MGIWDIYGLGPRGRSTWKLGFTQGKTDIDVEKKPGFPRKIVYKRLMFDGFWASRIYVSLPLQ